MVNDAVVNQNGTRHLPAIPFVKDIDFEHGVASEVAPGVRRIIAANPGPFTFTGSGSYIIGKGDIAIIDPGPDDPAHLDAILDTLGGETVSHILITHTHLDHCGGARELAERTGAPIYGFGAHPVAKRKHDAPALDEGADYSFAPDQLITGGDVLSGKNWRIEAVHTPGHLSNHLCFALPEHRVLFTGDHIMGWSTTVVAPPDGNMGDYLKSLDLLLERDDGVYFPTHGAPVKNPHQFVRAVRAHRRMRDGQILAQLKNGARKIDEIVPVLYADVDKRLHAAAALNVLAHLIRLVENETVFCAGAPSMNTEYWIA